MQDEPKKTSGWSESKKRYAKRVMSAAPVVFNADPAMDTDPPSAARRSPAPKRSAPLMNLSVPTPHARLALIDGPACLSGV